MGLQFSAMVKMIEYESALTYAAIIKEIGTQDAPAVQPSSPLKKGPSLVNLQHLAQEGPNPGMPSSSYGAGLLH